MLPVTKRPARSPAIKIAVTVMLTVAIIGALWVPIYERQGARR